MMDEHLSDPHLHVCRQAFVRKEKKPVKQHAHDPSLLKREERMERFVHGKTISWKLLEDADIGTLLSHTHIQTAPLYFRSSAYLSLPQRYLTARHDPSSLHPL